MGNYNRGNGRSRSFGDKREFNNSSSNRTTFYKATCGKCRKDCEVPFRPSGERPVLCRDCFQKNGGPEERRTNERNFSRPSYNSRTPSENKSNENAQYKEQLTAIHNKLDRIIQILTSPNSE
ncbi:hypothetical protein HGA88_05250 [Candidatus Roizmanbacteria bacterium]|nr:hypothetical protein [Candidatus Roizmanbacteria bacterium]